MKQVWSLHYHVILRRSLVGRQDREPFSHFIDKTEAQRREMVLRETEQLVNGGDRICTPVCKTALIKELTFIAHFLRARTYLKHFNYLMKLNLIVVLSLF